MSLHRWMNLNKKHMNKVFEVPEEVTRQSPKTYYFKV